MTFELQPELTAPRRSYLAPPVGPLTSARAIFWNERELRAGWRLAIFLLLVVVLGLGGLLLTVKLHLPKVVLTSVSLGALLLQEFRWFLSALIATATMGLLEGRPFGGYGLPGAKALGSRFWQGAIWGISMVTAIILLLWAFGGFSFGKLALSSADAMRYAALWGVIFLFVGLFEEFQFRGYALYTLGTGLRFWPAASILSAVFGGVHLFNPGEDKIGALSVFVIAMFFCFTLWRTGNLWFAVGLHAEIGRAHV